MSKPEHAPKKPDQRPTIGLLMAGISGQLSTSVWQGVTDAARERAVNVVCFMPRSRRPIETVDLNAQTSLLFDLASPDRVDGLVIWTAPIRDDIGAAGIQAIFDRHQSLPIVAIEEAPAGIPRVVVDNYRAMREAITHLIKVHNYRRIAFIRGPDPVHVGARQRYQAYLDVLAEHGLPINPDLVSPPSEDELAWATAVGGEGVSLLLDQRHADFDALVTANDLFARGALDVLRARGIHVPSQVAILGFDDAPQSRWLTPPLTTVSLQTYEQGQKATEMLLTLLEGGQVPDTVDVPLKLIVRQSCGCVNPAVVQAAAGPVRLIGKLPEGGMDAQRSGILTAMNQAANTAVAGLDPDWADQLLTAFLTELEDDAAGTFLPTLNMILRQVMTADGQVLEWQNVISMLRRCVLSHLSLEVLQRAEDLWLQAQVMLGEIAQRTQGYQALQSSAQAQLLNEIETALITTFDVEGLMHTLVRELPLLGMPSCYLSLYEDPQHPIARSRLVLAYDEHGILTPEPGTEVFPTPQLVPPGLLPQERPYSYVIEPLYFREEQSGFMLLEQGPRQGSTYDTLRELISSALQGALLVQRVEERSAELTRQQYILDTFMENIPDRIYFKDLDSRITRANKAFATWIGDSDPAEEVGRSDFDFFPEEQARVKYEQEQEIIRTGQPLLSIEEPDGVGRWALTTKMPLRDEHGQIVGTFGISHDITEMKQAQAELVRQERLSTLGQLTATVAHEIRNPLGTVRTCVFTIGDAIVREETERIMRALQLAERNIVRCDSIISELLDYTRDWVLQPSPTDIDAWLARILDELVIPEDIACVRALNANAKDVINLSIDSDHLRRAIINVVDNALDAMREVEPAEDGHRLTVSTCVVKDRLEIRISDTGSGIPDEMMDRLFEPLFSTKSFGVGLGLPIVKGIMEQHGGGVEISSQKDGGTTVVLWLPTPDGV